MIKRLRRIWRNVLVGIGLLLIPIGVVGVLLPTHLLGGFLVLGLILVLRNSIRWRRRFILAQRRFPRYGYPVRRALRGEVWPVVWHELLRTERFSAKCGIWLARRVPGLRRASWLEPRRLHVLRRIRGGWRRWRKVRD
jgi:hypothetical protein